LPISPEPPLLPRFGLFRRVVFTYPFAAQSADLRLLNFPLSPLSCHRIDGVGCEIGLAVDDIGVSLSDGGLIVVQAKAECVGSCCEGSIVRRPALRIT
jgi:hypothetical protein